MSYCFSVIDIGSNSIRMSVNRISEDGRWQVLEKMRKTVRLSENMDRDNYLKEESMARATQALVEFCSIAREYKCVSIAALATAAVRNAANGDVFIARVKEAAGIEIEVVSGQQEAYYSYLAVKSTLGIKDAIIMDTGGGSTEISLVKEGELLHSVSLPLGAVVMTERMLHSSQMQLYKYVSSYIGAVSWLEECMSLPLYGIGGSARALGMLYKRRNLTASEIDGLKIPYASVAKIYQQIFNTAPEKRKDIIGMEASRADIILAGITPAKVIMDMTGSKNMVIASSGLKEGVFFRMKDEILHKVGVY